MGLWLGNGLLYAEQHSGRCPRVNHTCTASEQHSRRCSEIRGPCDTDHGERCWRNRFIAGVSSTRGITVHARIIVVLAVCVVNVMLAMVAACLLKWQNEKANKEENVLKERKGFRCAWQTTRLEKLTVAQRGDLYLRSLPSWWRLATSVLHVE